VVWRKKKPDGNPRTVSERRSAVIRLIKTSR
jgi:hypothetical protein